VVNYFPGFAGVNGMAESGQLNPIFHSPSPYPPWAGLLICAAWSAASLALGAIVLQKRDA
jgi:ABC-2 type transport system permease protein